MIKHQSPLETVATLSEMSTLDIDINQSNRYCIKLNSAQGKDAYYFATPIYHAISRKLVNRNFVASNGYYRFVGSNCEATVTATQLKLVSRKKFLLSAKTSKSVVSKSLKATL